MSEEKKWLASDGKTELRPFDKVLVRDEDDEKWKSQFFSHCVEDGIYIYYTMAEDCYAQCIPYAGNESLAGTDGPIPEPRQAADKPLEWGERVIVSTSPSNGALGIFIGETTTGKYRIIIQGCNSPRVFGPLACRRL